MYYLYGAVGLIGLYFKEDSWLGWALVGIAIFLSIYKYLSELYH